MLIFRISLATIYVYCYALRCFKISSTSALCFHNKSFQLDKKSKFIRFFSLFKVASEKQFFSPSRKKIFINVHRRRSCTTIFRSTARCAINNSYQSPTVWCNLSTVNEDFLSRKKDVHLSTQQSRFEASRKLSKKKEIVRDAKRECWITKKFIKIKKHLRLSSVTSI